MQEPDSLNPTNFLSHVGRSLCFALPTSFVLWAIYSLISKIIGHGCEPVYDRSADSLYSGFTLILNCFLAALNPALFCLFEFWSCWRKINGGQVNGAAIELFSAGVVPLVIYVIFATKKGWLRHSSPEARSHTIRKIVFTSILFFLLIPFADQILSAPSNISKSFQVFTQTKIIAENTNPNNSTFMARTLAKTLGEAGKADQAMIVLLGAIDQDLQAKGGYHGNLLGHFNTLKYIDPTNELTTKEWLNLCKPVDSRLEATFIRFQNNKPGYYLSYLSAGQLSKPLIIGYLRHGATAEALKWQKIAAKYRRLKYGDTYSHDYLQLARTAHECHLDDEALAILQYSIALSESYYLNHISLQDDDTDSVSPYILIPAELDLYEKIVKAQPSDSWHWKNFDGWRKSRVLHEKTYSLIMNNNYQAAEALLLQAQSFDTGDTGCARAWSIYQNLLGTVELRLDKTAEAEKHYQLALQNDLLAAQGGPESADVARDFGYLAALYQKQGKLADADKLLSQALEMDRQILGDFALETKAMEANVIAFNTSQQRYKENEWLYKQAILKAEKRQKPDDVLIERINRLASFYIERNDYLRAEEQLARAFKACQDTGSFPKPTIANLDKLGDCYLSQSDYTKAAKQYERGYQLFEDKYSFDSDKALRLDKFTKLYIAQKDFVKAAETAKTALCIRRKHYTPALDIQKNEAEYLALLKKTTGRD
jgi:tetratricopeptide (TPR) repeat protein